MFDKHHYVPILKWRMGEYQAVKQLSDEVKNRVTPLFEIPTEPWDFDLEQPAKTIDEHIEKIGSRLKQKWGERRCFIDSPFYDGAAQTASGTHHLTHIFDLVRRSEANAIPVTGLERHVDYVASVKEIGRKDRKGVCIRLGVDDFQSDLQNKLLELVNEIGQSVAACDLVLDCAADITASAVAQGIVWKALLDQIPQRDSWRTLTVAGAAFPASLPAGVFRPHGIAVRHDWLG